MNDSNKEQSFWDKAVNTLLLTKSFEYEVDWTIEECVERIRGLAQPQKSMWSATSRKVAITSLQNQTCHFEISALRYSGGRGIVIATATGSMARNAANGKSIIRGKITLSTTLFISFVFAGVLIIVMAMMSPLIGRNKLIKEALPAAMAGAILGAILICGYFYLVGSNDTHELYNLIYDTFTQRKEKER